MNREPERLRVQIASASAKAAEFLTPLLSPDRVILLPVLTDAGSVRRALSENPPDLLLLNTPLPDEFGSQLAVEASEQYGVGVLIFVRAELYEQIICKTEAAGVLTLGRPVSRTAVSQSVQLLVATRARLRALEQRTQSLEAKMQEIRLVNRAKWLLVDHLHMTEPEAHRYIEKAAMDACVRRGEIAASILRTYEH